MADKSISALLSTLAPQLDERELVFCKVDEQACRRLNVLPVCLFKEANGISIVLERSQADQLALPYSGIWSLITCTVDSQLSEVGFLSAVTFRLAASGIRVKPVSGCSQDFWFVPRHDVDRVRSILLELSAG